MKTQNLHHLFVLLVFSCVLTAAQAHDHDHDTITGPNQGRILTEVEPHAEFFVTPERKVLITFVDDRGHVVAPAQQEVTVTTGSRAAPVRLAFIRQGDTLISDAPLPAGNHLPTVVQIQTAPGADPAAIRFNLDLNPCSGCNRKEYACTCDHHAH